MNPSRIDVWHNILWSQYKAEVFSSFYKLADKNEFDLHFFQLAETEGNRAVLSGIDTSRHRYPYELLFKGTLNAVSFGQKLKAILSRTWRSNAELFLLTGYEKPEIWAQILLIKLKRKKMVIFCDSTFYDQPQRFLRGLAKKLIFRSVDGIFGYGERSRAYVLSFGADPDKCYRRMQAAALPFDYTPEKALSARLANAPSTDAPRFLYVGRLSPEKGLETLLTAFAQFHMQNPQATLVLVGNGPTRDALEQQAQSLGLGGSVIFTGGKSGTELFDEYSKASAFILPSTSEPWGLVVNEALSFGCPVIVSDRCGCVPELVFESVTGFVFRAGDDASLAAKMEQIPVRFADVEKTAHACLDLMADYTPDHAGEQMIEACRIILAQAKN